MVNIYNVFKDLIWGSDDFTENLWYEGSGSVYWTNEENITDLLNGDGDTYSCEIYGRSTEREGFILYTLFDGCGNKVQSIFKLSNKIDPNDYNWCDEHEEYYHVDDVCEKCKSEAEYE